MRVVLMYTVRVRDVVKVRVTHFGGVTTSNYVLLKAPANAVGSKIWTCYDNLPAQQWFYTADNRIALENQGMYRDLCRSSAT